jgi:Na+-translocating ferredoxin:NAD+ oxidoreductase RnfC subunit
MEGIEMPYVNKPRPYKKEYQEQKERPEEHARRMERQRLRRAYDKTHYDSPLDKDKTAESREGKDLAHKVALDKGGSNKQGYSVQSKSQNRSFRRDSKSNLVSEISKKEKSKAVKAKKK